MKKALIAIAIIACGCQKEVSRSCPKVIEAGIGSITLDDKRVIELVNMHRTRGGEWELMYKAGDEYCNN